MPVCVECGASVSDLYKVYSKSSLRLTHCSQCGCVADRYIEYEHLLILIDMLLHKPAVYRHLLFNRLPNSHRDVTQRVFKLGLLCVMCDAYLKCTKLYFSPDTVLPLSEVWGLFVLAWLAAALGFVVYSLGVCFLVHVFVQRMTYATLHSLLWMPLLLSSFVRLLVVLMWVWDYHDVAFGYVIAALCLSSNAEALHASLRLGYAQAYLFVGVSFLASCLFQLALAPYIDNPFLSIVI